MILTYLSKLKLKVPIATLAYILCIFLLNYSFGRVPHLQWHGYSFTWIDLLVGMIFVFRDFAQRELGHYVMLAMLLGAGLSYLFADPAIAIASTGAFAIAETIDWAVYSYTGWPFKRRILYSSLLSSPIDSWFFLYWVDELNPVSMLLITSTKFMGVLAVYWLWQKRESMRPLAQKGTG